MKIYHSRECTENHAAAEKISGVNLFCPDCPRCKLNSAAPDLYEAGKNIAKYAFSYIPSDTGIKRYAITKEDYEKIVKAVAKAEGK